MLIPVHNKSLYMKKLKEKLPLIFILAFTIFFIIPFIIYPYGIAQDYPNHYAAYSVAFQKLQGSLPHSFYDVQWRLFPHLTMAILALPIIFGVNISLSFNIFLILSALMPIFGAWILHWHIYKKTSWSLMLCLGLFYNFCLYLGFLDFNFSLGLSFILYTIYLCQNQNPTFLGYVSLTFGASLLFLAHLFGFFIFSVIVSSHIFYVIAQATIWRTRLKIFFSPLLWLWPIGILGYFSIMKGPITLPHEKLWIGLPRLNMIISAFLQPFFFGHTWSAVFFVILFIIVFPYALYVKVIHMKRVNAIVSGTLFVTTILFSQRIGGVALDFRLGMVTCLYTASVINLSSINNSKKKTVVVFSAILLFSGLFLQGINGWKIMKMTNNEVSAIRDAIQKIPLKSTLIAASSSDSRPFLHAGSFIVSDRDGFFPLLFQVVQPLYARSAFASINLPGVEMSGKRLTANATKPPCKAPNNDWFNLKFDHGWPLNFDYLIWFSSSAEAMKKFVFLNKVAEGKHFHLYEIDKQKAIYFFQKSNEGEKDCFIVGE